MFLLHLLQWIQDTRVGTSIRESNYVFVIILGFHALALAVSVGIVFWFDLRLLGVAMCEQPVSELYRNLMPWMIGGFTIMFATGLLLLWAQAARCYENVYCHTKIPLLLLPAANAGIYHMVSERNRRQWDRHPMPPVGARNAGVESIGPCAP